MLLQDWRFLTFLSALFAALTAVFAKLGVSSINSNLATFIRTIVVIILTAAIITFNKQWQPLNVLDGRSIKFLVLSAFGTAGSWLCFYRALQLGPASRVTPLDKVSVALTIILSAIFLGEVLSWKVILGGLLIVTGSVIIAL